MTKRPLSVAIVACVYIAVGAIGFVSYFFGLDTLHPIPYDGLWVELIRLTAIISGAFLLRAHNWARWVALAWIAFHVILSAFHSLSQLAVHAVFCAVIAWVLFRPAVDRYFRPRTLQTYKG